jgi:hypothetical protein
MVHHCQTRMERSNGALNLEDISVLAFYRMFSVSKWRRHEVRLLGHLWTQNRLMSFTAVNWFGGIDTGVIDLKSTFH